MIHPFFFCRPMQLIVLLKFKKKKCNSTILQVALKFRGMWRILKESSLGLSLPKAVFEIDTFTSL